MTREYTRRPDLYDVEHLGDVLPGEIDFYRQLAVESGGPVLELGFGTGRVGLEIARAGVEVVGLDLSVPMLDRAREKLAAEPDDVRERVTLVRANMHDFTLDRQFALIYVPFRAFLHLKTQEEQRAALACVRGHLTDGGRFAGNFFRPDPALLQQFPNERLESAVLGPDGRSYIRGAWSAACDTHEQFKEIVFHTRVYGADGELEIDRIDFLEMAWIFGREWRLLLEVEGLRLDRLDGGFNGEPVSQGKEYVWVASKRR